MRFLLSFILGFIVYGLIFYGIWLYSPQTIQMLTTWANNAIDAVRGLLQPHSAAAPEPAKSLLFLYSWWTYSR